MANGYLAVFKISFKEFLSYKSSAALTAALTLVYPLLLVFVWKAVYASTGGATIGGLTLNQMYVYFFFNVVGLLVAESFIVWQMRDCVKEGCLASDLARPVAYPKFIFATALSQPVFNIVFAGIPLVALLIVATGITVTPLTLAMFALALCVDYAIANLFSFIFGTLTIYLTDVSGLFNAFLGMATLLGGGVMPLLLFPAWAQHVLYLLPFQFIVFVPSAVMTGLITAQAFLGFMAVGAAWIAALLVVAWLLWKKARVMINAVGV